MRALIADDDRIVTTLLSWALAEWHFDVSVAHDGESAWELTRTQAPQRRSSTETGRSARLSAFAEATADRRSPWRRLVSRAARLA
jgi:CheY-like chemotaxis protein